MADWTQITNRLTEVDNKLKAKLDNTLIMLSGTNAETKVPVRMIGVEEEFNTVAYPIWIINPLDLNLDLRRFSDERQVVANDSQSKKIKQPPLPMLITYVISGYSQLMRHYRAMQFFLASTFPVHAFLTLDDGTNCRVDLKSSNYTLNKEDKELVYQNIYDVWVMLDWDTVGQIVKTVFNTVTIQFKEKDGWSAIEPTENYSWSVA